MQHKRFANVRKKFYKLRHLDVKTTGIYYLRSVNKNCRLFLWNLSKKRKN